MPSHTKPDIHKAGVFYACYMLTKLGYAAIETNGTEAHMTGTKDGKTEETMSKDYIIIMRK